MPIIQLIVILVVIGVIMWLFNQYVPLAEPWKKILNIVVILLTCLWLLNVVGLFTGLELLSELARIKCGRMISAIVTAIHLATFAHRLSEALCL